MGGHSQATRWGITQYPLLVFAFGLVVIVLVDWLNVMGPLVGSWTDVTVSWTVQILHTLGLEATSDGVIVAHPNGFAYEIHYRCIGLVPMACLTLAVTIERATIWQKVVGLGFGSLLLIGVNFIRLVHLYVIGVSAPQHFWYMHEIVWQSVTILSILLILGIWLIWVRGTLIRPIMSGVIHYLHRRVFQVTANSRKTR